MAHSSWDTLYMCVYICICIYTHTHTHTHKHKYSRVSFAAVRFTTIHFYDSCGVGRSTLDLWCITVATQASFLYLLRFQLFSGVRVFLLFLFQCSSFKLIVILPPMTSIKKTEKINTVDITFFLMSSEPRPGPSSTKVI